MRADRGGEHGALQITPLADEIVDRVAVAGVHHVLVDDGPLIERGRHVVRGGPHELHAALVGLVVRLLSDERRKKGVVDVDDAVRELGDELGAQDLHVASEDDEVDPERPDELELGFFLCAARLGRDGEDVIGDAELTGHRLEVGVVADDRGDLAAELARPMPEQQVVEAMVVLRDEEGDAPDLAVVREAVGHTETLRHLRDAARQGHAIGVELPRVEPDSLEELPRVDVGVLIGVEDVGAVPVEQLREGRDDPALVAAGDEQRRGGVLCGDHRRRSLQRNRTEPEDLCSTGAVSRCWLPSRYRQDTRRRCRRCRSSRWDSSRGTAGDIPRRSRTRPPGRSQS